MTTWYSRQVVANGARSTEQGDGAAKVPANRTIKASEFKARCLKLMDDVVRSGGEEMSRLVPCRQRPERLFGADRDTIGIRGDIIDPPDVEPDVEWEAEVDPDHVVNP